jgi:N6-adenosine-specific RNA methylase IME4
MWATMPKLDVAIALGKAWGLTYKTVAFTWVKINESHTGVWFTQPMSTDVWKMGLGYWTRGNAELVLLFTWGSPKRKAKDISQVVVAPVTRHSEKPEAAQDRIERLVDGPYCELFARRVRDNWFCLGNEIDGLDIFEAIATVATETKAVDHYER